MPAPVQGRGSQQLCLHLCRGRLHNCACTCSGERLPTAVPVPVQGEARQLCLHLCTGGAPNSCDCTCAGGDSRQLCLHLCRARLSIVVLAPVREVGGSQKLCLHLCGERLDSCACTCTGRDSQQLCLHLCRVEAPKSCACTCAGRDFRQLCLHRCRREAPNSCACTCAVVVVGGGAAPAAVPNQRHQWPLGFNTTQRRRAKPAGHTAGFV